MRKSLVIPLVILVALACSCAKKPAVKKVDDPGVMYVQAVDLMNQKKYDKSIDIFSKLRESYPFDPIAIVAQVKQADAMFAKKDYQAAANTYEDFVNNYPEDENAPYAMKRLGESYLKELPTIDRDQTITFKAVERFTYLKNRYPASPYAKDAEQQLKFLNQHLASREFYIGEFYYKSGNYNASVMRLEYLINRYPETKDKEKAFYLLAEDNNELDRPDRVQYYRDLLAKEFPKSKYVGQLPRERKTRKTEQAKASPKKTATVKSQSSSPPATAVMSYEERKKKELPLVPLSPKPDRTSSEGVINKQSENESAPGTSNNSPAAASESNRQSGKETQVARASAPRVAASPKAEVSPSKGLSSRPDATPNTNKDGDKGDKKDSLGFFTGKGPIEIDGDSGESRDNNKVLMFKGNVIAKQIDADPAQTFYLFCDALTAYTSEDTKEIDRAEASGNVKLVKQANTATAKQAFYYRQKAQIVLKGDVVVFMGADKLSADTVTYYIDEDRFYVQGDKDKRAKVTITPKK